MYNIIVYCIISYYSIISTVCHSLLLQLRVDDLDGAVELPHAPEVGPPLVVVGLEEGLRELDEVALQVGGLHHPVRRVAQVLYK